MGYTCKEHTFFTLSQEKFHNHIMDEHVANSPVAKPYEGRGLSGDLVVTKVVKKEGKKECQQDIL